MGRQKEKEKKVVRKSLEKESSRVFRPQLQVGGVDYYRPLHVSGNNRIIISNPSLFVFGISYLDYLASTSNIRLL